MSTIDHPEAARVARQEIASCDLEGAEADSCEDGAHILALAYLDLRTKAKAYIASNPTSYESVCGESLRNIQDCEWLLRSALTPAPEDPKP